MVLLENFGVEPLTIQFNRPNWNKPEALLPRQVVRTMVLRIPKLRKENYPERAKKKGNQFSHTVIEFQGRQADGN